MQKAIDNFADRYIIIYCICSVTRVTRLALPHSLALQQGIMVLIFHVI